MADSNMYAFLPLSSKVLLCSAGVQTEIPVSRLHRGELMTFLTPYTAIIPSTQTLQGVSRVSWLPRSGRCNRRLKTIAMATAGTPEAGVAATGLHRISRREVLTQVACSCLLIASKLNAPFPQSFAKKRCGPSQMREAKQKQHP